MILNILFIGLVSFAGSGKPDKNCVSDKAFVKEVCQLVNKHRVLYKLKPLVLSNALNRVAHNHAADMIQRNYFSHTSPEGLSGGDRIVRAGIAWSTWGENIAMYFKTPEEVMKAWMDSPGHRKNILERDFGKIGIGYHQNSWVQNFTD